MRSHFSLPRGVATAAAVAGASTLLTGNCSASNNLIAADYATNSTYAAGWTNGQNGGTGFGPWSFDGTNPTPLTNSAGAYLQYQAMTTSSPLGKSWTLLTYNNHAGLSDVGRAITEPGGLQPGQTLEAVIQNPLGYHFYRGFDILYFNGTNNAFGGVNTAALRTMIFTAYSTTSYWDLVDETGDNYASLDINSTGSAGMKFDLALTSTNTYTATLTPLANPSAAFTNSGTLVATNLPINWVNFRLWFGTSAGTNDTANNFEISSMTIQGLALNIQKEGTNVLLSWPTLFTNFALVSSTDLTVPGWSLVSNTPAVVNGQNVVTNPIAGSTKQFYRLQFQQPQ
jgi:hypothetical protein